MEDIRIEFPCSGATYHYPDQYGVYKYGVYPRSSVLAGQESRSFLGRFDTLEEARSAFPNADETGCCYNEVELPINPPSWFDPSYAGEHWSEDE